METDIGKIYGDLIIVSYVGRNSHGDILVRCKCVCGKETITKRTNLRSGVTRSCGCLRNRTDHSIDLSGQRFGKLLVIKKSRKGKFGHSIFLCKCDCGNEKEILGCHLVNKIKPTKSCGCLWIKDRGEAALNSLYSHTRQGAIVRNLDWKISKDRFAKLSKQNCHYCGAEPSQIYGKNHNGTYVYNGIDRVDNSIGYIIENCVPCCGVCNRMKHSMPVNKFLNHIKNIYKHIKP